MVTKGESAHTIVGGNPARVLRRRFSETIGRRLGALAWWDWSSERRGAGLSDCRSLPIKAFPEKYEAQPGPEDPKRSTT